MRVNEFHNAVVAATRAQLPPRLRTFRSRKRFTLVQLYYDKRTLHYEVWVRGKERFIEIGLHFESDRATNAALLGYFSTRVFEIKDALGDAVEVEQWTASWARAHRLMPYTKLDEPTVAQVAKELARMIEVLQPMLERASRTAISAKTRAPR